MKSTRSVASLTIPQSPAMCRRRAAGASKTHGGNSRIGASAGRPQTSPTGQVDTTNVRLWGCLRRPGEVISVRGRATSIGFGAEVAAPEDRKAGDIFREVQPEVRPDPGIRRAAASARSRRADTQAHLGRAQECVGQTVPSTVGDGEHRTQLCRRGAERYRPKRRSSARPVRTACAPSWKAFRSTPCLLASKASRR